ncbi:hypothetical protein QF032_005972 [Streptomyces achromogenes]|nr:hypothetical protein [Streptomyces achromogenes]
MTALATATPMIAVPQAVDQFGNADVLKELGVARRIDTADATAEALREAALALVDDPEVARRLRTFQAEMAAEGGTPRAADLVEAELDKHAAEPGTRKGPSTPGESTGPQDDRLAGTPRGVRPSPAGPRRPVPPA